MTDLPTREIFANFSFLIKLIFYLVSAGAMGIFVFGFYRRIQKYRKGRPAMRFNNLNQRLLKAFRIMLVNATIFKRDVYTGLAHLLIFWGFVILFIGTCIVALDHDFLELFFNYKLLQGSFYQWFSLVLDISGILFLFGLLLMIIRRCVIKPPQLDYTRVDIAGGQYDRSGFEADDKIFLWLLFFIGLTGFFIEGFRIAAEGMPTFEVWSPAGWPLASRISTAAGKSLHAYTWWFHTIMVLAFIAYIPYSKAMHILVDFASLVFSNENAARVLPPLSEEEMQKGMGYQKIVDFTWKELLDFDACTKCGRCHYACPARASGAPLSPRDLILDLRAYADSVLGVPEWLGEKFNGNSKWSGVNTNDITVAGNVIEQKTLWACTTCMACQEACPVGIEHLTSIVQMRRHLVDKGSMEDTLQEALMNIGDYGNSFGQPERARAKWTQTLDFKIKDLRKEKAEFLWFVGDYASYNANVQELSRKTARLLKGIGVDFGILYDGEKNAGNDVRRIGEEGLYEMLVEDNLAVLEKANFDSIFTTDPHSFNTIKNEYPEFGGNFTIYHYTRLLVKLIDKGVLKFSKKLDYTVTFHDPCYLGRYNKETEAPRKLLRALGVKIREMPRCGANTFCCGAGGGRIWMDDSNLKERPSVMRIKEALAINDVQIFVVACPKDYTMYCDAVKTTGNQEKIVVKDIIELVEEAV